MILIPRFGEDSSKKAVAKFSSPPEALQEFCQNCLWYKYPHFYVFPLLGCDGAIDGIQDSTWVECKYCPEDKSSAVIKRWKETEKSLRANLAKGKSHCPKQYLPWFSLNPHVQKYILFTNASLSHLNATQEVKEYISNVFSELSTLNPNLKHLANVKIEIWHWRSILPLIQENTNLLYRWFWEFWPEGITPLDFEPEGGFRSYLQSTKLPYYSLENYKNISRTICPISTEKEIIGSLNKTDKIGRIIVGQAGVGKTRMALQIGDLAKKDGWIVFRVNVYSTPLSSIGKIFEELKDLDKVLLIIDYVELMENFKGITEEINNYNKKYAGKVFYIATVRHSYYRGVLREESTHEPIYLSGGHFDGFTLGYREKVVHHILESSKLKDFEKYIPICKGIPVMAVLFKYLHEHNKSIDLSKILETKDFGIWFAKHLELTLSFTENSLVAKFMLCLPISEQILENMPSEIKQIKQKLSTDGWIEPYNDDNKRRYAIHDIISDMVVISYCQSIEPEVRSFVKESFEFAREYSCLGSALATFERVDNELFDISWDSLITIEITKYPDEWKIHRLKLLRTSLLDESQQIMLLAEIKDYWTDLFAEPSFHQAIGWLIGWLHDQGNPKSRRNTILKEIIEPFINPIIGHITNNFFLCRILQLFPEKFSQKALEWIDKTSDESKKTFILCAYIRSGYQYPELEKEVTKWFEIHPTEFETYHILQALFKVERISQIEVEWLKEWLSINHNSKKVTKLINLFLDKGGQFNDLKEYYIKYIKDPTRSSFLVNDLVRKKHLPRDLESCCVQWCKQNPDDPQSIWNLKRLLWYNYDGNLIEEFVETLESILSKLKQEEISKEASSTINCIVYKLLFKAHKTPKLYKKILKCFIQCLQKGYSFTQDTNIYTEIQDKVFPYALIQLLKGNLLKKDKDYDKILNFMKWYGRWEPINKTRVNKQLNYLRFKYPSNVWNNT